jgi:3-oxoadipate enol-lactonase
VLLHPVGLDGYAWQAVAVRLAGRRTVFAPTLRGHGRSPAPDPPWTVQDLAADVLSALSDRGLVPAHVVGLSLGGMVAQQLALDHPAVVCSLTLISSSGGFDEPVRGVLRDRGVRALEGGMAAVVDETLTRWFGTRARAGLAAARVRERLLGDDPGLWAATWDAMARFDVRSRLAELDIPALVLGCGEDASTPPAVLAELASLLPRATLQIVPETGHLGPLERPGRFAELIGAFLNTHVTSRREPT